MQNSVYIVGNADKVEHFLQECAAWLRLLDFLKQENAYLKTRLSKMVDENMDKIFLNEAENFQNLFIIKDEFIQEISRDAKLHDMKLRQVLQLKNKIDEELNKQQLKLRSEIDHLEREFIRMKNEFNKNLLSAF
jgi:hypothetical protein